MQKVIIDTNVFISYLLSSKSHPYKIVDELFLENIILHFISEETGDEYVDVLSRAKFSKLIPEFSELAFTLFTQIIELSTMMKPQQNFSVIKDENDNKFLDVAYLAEADFIITGNTKDFTFPIFFNTQIVNPRDYWELFKP